MKMKVILLLAIAIAAALVTQPMRAATINTLVITENNSTASGLTALLNGTTFLSVTFNGADNWTINLTTEMVGGGQDWAEPGAAAGVNNLVEGQGSGISVRSDDLTGTPGLANGTTDTMSFNLFAPDHTVIGPLWVTFNDNGDVAAAPDTGSTLGLLSLALTALLGTSRLRSFQLA